MVGNFSLALSPRFLLHIGEVKDVSSSSVSVVESLFIAHYRLSIRLVILSSIVLNLDDASDGWLQLVHTLDLWASLLWHVDTAQMSFLLLDVQVINVSALWLVDLVSHLEVTLAGLLRRDNGFTVHVDLVDSVVELVAVQLSKDLFAKGVVSLEITALVLSN